MTDDVEDIFFTISLVYYRNRHDLRMSSTACEGQKKLHIFKKHLRNIAGWKSENIKK